MNTSVLGPIVSAILALLVFAVQWGINIATLNAMKNEIKKLGTEVRKTRRSQIRTRRRVEALEQKTRECCDGEAGDGI